MYNLFLDDERYPKDVLLYMVNAGIYVNVDWEIVRNYDEFVAIIKQKGIPYMVSFDHDLADEHYGQQSNIDYSLYKEKTGYECAKWLIDYCIDNGLDIPEKILIHTRNYEGGQNIISLFRTYKKIYGK